MGLGLLGRSRQLLRIGMHMATYPVLKTFPRSPRKWLFGHSDNEFAGNPKYLYLWMLLNRPDVQVKWSTNRQTVLDLMTNLGLPVVKRSSIRGVLSALQAGVFAYSHDIDDISLLLSPGAYPLNLWHGVGLKSLYTDRRWPKGIWGWLRSFIDPNPTMVVSTSPTMQRHFAKQFRIDLSKSPILGYPRVDVSIDLELRNFALDIDRSAGLGFNKEGIDEVYLYVPTFRDSKRPFLNRAIPDPDRLNAILKERNAVLYLKLHPRTAKESLGDDDRIRGWPTGLDIQPYLLDIDCLITDYSSILYDYISSEDRGVVLYAFDLEEYEAADRAMTAKFADNVAGNVVRNFDDLCIALQTGSALEPIDNQQLSTIRERFWRPLSTSSSAAVVDWTLQQVS